ncbi:uncharacterized protein [Montipora capricornis]|uniref:uncharacterized protein n=1 Tax=Montipora capricornis TaxID=246305 RepID=UPI0035F1A278
MAEGLNNDMSEQHQREQASVPHGQEADRSLQVQFVIPATNVQHASTTQPKPTSNILAPIPGHKKKSSFQITSVIETKARNRGDSNGYDGDLNESDIVDDEPEVQVELGPFSDPHGTANGNGGSRFKVVKLQRDESYVRGRWKCHDFPDVESTQSSSTSVSASSSTCVSTLSSKDSVEKSDSHSSARINTTSSTVGNHITSDTDSSSLDIPTHGSSVRSTASQSNEQNSVQSEINVVSKKKDSEPKMSLVSEPTKQSESPVAKLPSGLDNLDRLSQEGTQSIAAAGLGPGEAEMPIVNKIATAMEQITQIKSDLLSVVNKEVQTLKETISKLTEENLELRLENEKLRTLVERKSST